MRRENDVVAAEQLRILGQWLGGHDIERGAAEAAGIERCDQRGLIDQRPTRGQQPGEPAMTEREEVLGQQLALALQREGDVRERRALDRKPVQHRRHALGDELAQGVRLGHVGPLPVRALEDHPIDARLHEEAQGLVLPVLLELGHGDLRVVAALPGGAERVLDEFIKIDQHVRDHQPDDVGLPGAHPPGRAVRHVSPLGGDGADALAGGFLDRPLAGQGVGDGRMVQA